jgi:hypothetical protein
MRVTLRRQLEMQAVGDKTRSWGIVIQGDSVLFSAEDAYSVLSLTGSVIHFYLSPQVLPLFI